MYSVQIARIHREGEIGVSVHPPHILFDGIDEVAAAKAVCHHLGENRADQERHFMNVKRDEIERDVAGVAIGPHPPASVLRERGARVARLSEASIHGVRVEFQHEVWRARCRQTVMGRFNVAVKVEPCSVTIVCC